MVYPGHPSRGCETCRVRKVKCDEAKPTCLRCAKVNRPCLGYRVLDDGRPQKQSAIRKSHTDTKSSIPGMNPALIRSGSQTSIVSGGVPDAYVSPLLDSLSRFPRLSLNQVNLHRLSSHIAHLPQISGVYGGCLTCLPDVSETSPLSSPLYPALSALLLAFISRGNETVGTLKDASESYGHALRLTRHIICRKEATREREVILTTLILSMYEDLVNAQQQPTSLNPHVRGAIALMKAHSVECHKDATMKRLYGAFATRVMYTSYRNCLHLSDDEFPLTISELRGLHEAAPIAKGLTAARPDLQPAVCKLLEAHLLLRDIEAKTMPDKDAIDTLEGVIKSIDEIETVMSLWPQNLPADHAPEAVQLSPDAVDSWSSTSLVYLAFWVANAWAHYRSVRIFANDLLLWAYDLVTPAVITESTNLSFAELTIRMQVAHKQIQSSASEICASMPYHLGYSVRGSDERRYPKEGFPGGRYSRKMSACNIVWPLYTAGVVDGLNPSQKLWIARQLDFLSHHVGVRQASTLAMGIRSRVYENDKMACLLIEES